jgi:GH35 family endo-1,4-beta-xylanase
MRKYTFFALASLLSPLTTARAELPPDLRLEADSAIDQHRKGTLIIQTPPGARVSVEQMRHEFWFGAALASSVFGGRMQAETREKYLSVFLENFNAAVTENALKWHCMEPTRGQVDYSTVNAILEWCDRHQVPLRGHNIFWGVPKEVQDWLKELSDDDLRQVVRDRALDIGTRYRGRFAEYDLNNEMIHGNYYEYRLGKDITLKMARWVREADPKAVLFLNDYDILTGKRLDDYIKHIQGLLDQGVPVGGIGAQGHLHGESFDPIVLRNSLEKLAQFRLPIRITEFNMPGQRCRFYEDKSLRLTDAEEEAKAKAIVDYYRLCFAQPRVEGILMWGFWEGANWIPASSLYKRDWTPLPAASAYRDLVFKQWWTRAQGQADAQGRYEVRAFYGKYRVTVEGKEVVVDLSKAEGRKTVSVK